MAPINFYFAFKSLYDPKDMEVLIRALRQDPLIWDYVNTHYETLVANVYYRNVSAWLPGNLGLHALGLAPDQADQAVQKAIRIIEGIEKPITRIDQLEQAAALAYSLLNDPSSVSLSSCLMPFEENAEIQLSIEGYKSVAACTPVEELRKQKLPVSVLLHAMLCHPWSEEQMRKEVIEWSILLPVSEQVEIIQLLTQNGRGGVASSLAKAIHAGISHTDTCGSQSIESIQQKAFILKAAGKADDAEQVLDNYLSYLTHIKERVVRQQNTLNPGDKEKSLLTTHDGFNEKVADWFDMGLTDEAKETGRALAHQFVNLQEAKSNEIENSYILTADPMLFLERFHALNLIEEGLSAAFRCLKERPHDEVLNSYISTLLSEKAENDQAIQYAEVALSLKPEAITHHRKLARLYSKSGKLDESLAVWSDLTKNNEEQMAAEDWVDYAQSAFQSGLFEEAERSCKKALEIDSQNAGAFYLLGITSLAKGDLHQAVVNLQKTVMFHSENNEAWLDLARAYELNNDQTGALDVLRSGVMANPKSYAMNYSLAIKLLEAGIHSEALPYLKTCAYLKPISAETAAKLGTTLFNLGSLTDSEKVLSEAFKEWPFDKDLASAYADTLMALNKKEEAIQPLELLVDHGAQDIDILMKYAGSVLAAEEPVFTHSDSIGADRLNKGIAILDQVLHLEPENRTARLWLAEAILARGEGANAKSLYLNLYNQTWSSDFPVNNRLKAGLGYACLQIGEIEAAIAAFQEVTRESAPSIFMLEKLAEAYAYGDLNQDAIDVADRMLEIYPDNFDVLEWYGKFTESLGQYPKALSAKTISADLQPENPKLVLDTARLYIQQGEKESAKLWLERALGMENLKADDYRAAAYSYLRLQNIQAGIICLQKAVDILQEPTPDMILELSILSQSFYGVDEALRILQSGLEKHPDNEYLLTYQADLFQSLNLEQSAFDSLTKAYEARKARHENQMVQVMTPGFVSQEWMGNFVAETSIESRMAALQFGWGNLKKGLEILLHSLDSNRDNLGLRTKALEAAYSLLDFDVIHSLTTFKITENELTEGNSSFAGYYQVLADIALFQRKLGDAEKYLESLWVLEPESARSSALQARVCLRRGDYQTAQEYYHSALQLQSCEVDSQQKKISEGDSLSTIHTCDFLAEAALEMGDFDRAMKYSKLSVEKQGGSLLNLLWLIRMITEIAYVEKMRKEFQVINHLVQKDWLDDGIGQLEAIGTLSKTIRNSTRIDEWIALGQAVLEQTPVFVHQMMQYQPDASTARYQVAVMRWINNESNALEICDRYPDNADLLLQKSMIYLNSDIETAVKTIAKAIHHAPNQPLNYYAAAKMVAEQGDYEGALVEMDAALKIWPDEPAWLTLAAQYADKVGDSDMALSLYQKAAQAAPQDAEYAINFAYAMLDMDKPEPTAEYLEIESRKHPDNRDITVALGTSYMKMDDLVRAKEQLNILEKSGYEVSDRYILQSQIAYKETRDTDALIAAQKAVQLELNGNAAMYYQIQLLKTLNRPVEALSNLEQYISKESSPDDEFRVLHTELVNKVDGPQAALNTLPSLEALPNKSLQVYQLISQIYYETQNYEKFSDSALAGLRLNPQDPELNFRLGKIQSQNGQLDQAVQCFSEVILHQPDNLEAYLELSAIYLKRREIEQALQILQKAIAVFPDDYHAYYETGLLLRDIKDYVGAEKMLRKAASLEPGDVTIRRQLGALIALNLVHQV